MFSWHFVMIPLPLIQYFLWTGRKKGWKLNKFLWTEWWKTNIKQAVQKWISAIPTYWKLDFFIPFLGNLKQTKRVVLYWIKFHLWSLPNLRIFNLSERVKNIVLIKNISWGNTIHSKYNGKSLKKHSR